MGVVTFIGVVATFVVGATTLTLAQWQHHHDARHGDVRWAVEMALHQDPVPRAAGLAILEEFKLREKLSKREYRFISTILYIVPAMHREEPLS